MRVNFRQGIVSHQAPTKSESGYGSFLPGFLQKSGNNYNLIATSKPVTLTVAHKDTNYTFTEDTSVANAWMGPFTTEQNYWLYWDFNPLTFERSFGYTTIEPIAQHIEPGSSDAPIKQIIAGVSGVGRIIVDGYYAPHSGRKLVVADASNNTTTYTIASSSFDGNTGYTSIFTKEEILTNASAGGIAAFDIDSYGLPLKHPDRHWFDTKNMTHKVWKGTYWAEVLRVFAVHITHGGSSVFPHTIAHGTTLGTQIGNTASARSGRIMFDEDSNTIRRDNGTFFTTEDQFFSNASRVDAIRLESNVARAQFEIDNAVAAFTPVAWVGEGKCRVARYDDIGNTVIGILTEDVMKNEVGGVVIQGVVTNPAWNWSSSNPSYNYIRVGDPLWIEDGAFVPYDPHALNGVEYPNGRVPVARILSSDTIIFEQGLGGKGDRGPAGSLDNLPDASYEVQGGVFLSLDPEVAEEPIAVGDNDYRLLSSYPHTPTAHNHAATSVQFAPAGNITNENAQLAIEELDFIKLSKSGGTMTGPLTLEALPTQPMHAASKEYVDGLVSGLLWLDPIDIVNLISYDTATPPTNAAYSDAYIVPSNPTGAWALGNPQGIQTGDLVIWSGATWERVGPLSNTGYRFGIAMTSGTSAKGSLSGHDHEILVVPNGTNLANVTFEVPVDGNAVYVDDEISKYAFKQFAYSIKVSTSERKWIAIGGTSGVNVDNVTIMQSGSTIGTIPYNQGGTVDAATLQGNTLSQLDTRYAPATHSHTGSSVGITPYTTSPNWGTPTAPESVQINSVNVEQAIRELNNDKASKTPSYNSKTDFPVASTVQGMVAYSIADQHIYVASNGSWSRLLRLNNGAIELPYDMGFSIQGPIYADYTQAAYVATRPVTIPAGAPGSIARAITPLINNATLDIEHNGNTVGSIMFTSGVPLGTIILSSPITLIAGDVLTITYKGATTINDNNAIAVTFAGTALTTLE